MTEYVFIDESGDLGLDGSKFLILAALIIDDYRPLNKIIKDMRRSKFKKELRQNMEIKASHSPKKVILYALEKLSKLKNARIQYVVLEKKKLSSKFLKNNKHKLYNYVAGKLAKNLSFKQNEIEIRIDKSKGSQELQEDFNNYFKKNLDPKHLEKIKLIAHSYSHSWPALQLVDVIAWACYQKFEKNNSEYIDLIKIEQEACYVW